MDLRSPSTRLLIVAAVLALWTGAALARLAYLQLFRYSDFLARAERQQQHIVEISPQARRHPRPQSAGAGHERRRSIPASPFRRRSPIHDRRRACSAPVVGLPPDEIETRLGSSRSFVWIARKLPPDTVARIRKLNLRGIYFQKEDQRFYPKRDLAAAVLGYVDIDEKGIGGIEYALDDRIRSKPRRMLILTDAHSRWYDSSDKTPEAGTSVVLTIDENIQFIAEKELAAAINADARQGRHRDRPGSHRTAKFWPWPTGPRSIPTRRPAAVRGSAHEPRHRRAVRAGLGVQDRDALRGHRSGHHHARRSGGLPDGRDLHRGTPHPRSQRLWLADRCRRFWRIPATSAPSRSACASARPSFTTTFALTVSAAPTGIDLPGENRGLLRRLENWTPVSVGSISMGQEVGVTPLQMINAVSAIANGGLLYRPHVVLALRRGAQVEQEPQPEPKRVVRETTAAAMRAMLEGVVLNGTGNARRSSTAIPPRARRARRKKSIPPRAAIPPTQLIASFVGFAPINNPAVTILVQLDSPVGEHEGGSVAAPVFKRIAEQVLAYLNVPRDVPVAPATLRAARHSQAAQTADVSDYDPAQFTPVEYGRFLACGIVFGRARGFRRGCGVASGADGGAGRGRGRIGSRSEREDGSAGDRDLRAAGRKPGAGRRGHGAVSSRPSRERWCAPALR